MIVNDIQFLYLTHEPQHGFLGMLATLIVNNEVGGITQQHGEIITLEAFKSNPTNHYYSMMNYMDGHQNVLFWLMMYNTRLGLKKCSCCDHCEVALRCDGLSSIEVWETT